MRFVIRSLSLAAVVTFAIVFCSATTVRAADATAPAATGTIKGKVMTADGKPANGVTVRLVAADPAAKPKGGKKAKAAANANAAQPQQAQALAAKGAKAGKGAGKSGKKAAALKETTTNDQGEFTFTDVPAGHYAVYAGGKGIGNGHAPAEVTGGNSVNLSLTLKMGKKAEKVGGNGKSPRPEPAAQDPAK